jgi:serine phosphatase RsbU (regulator of sigma subunit)/anti-sigma regulatory factor (Ser/Thr protein kinase)
MTPALKAQPQGIRMAKLLIIDDDPQTLRAIVRVLRGLSHEVDLASSRREGTEMVRANDYAAILADHHLADGHGLDVLEYARGKQPDAVRIMLTGDLDGKVAIDSINTAKVSHFIAKPWHPAQLREIVRSSVASFERKQARDAHATKLQLESRRLSREVLLAGAVQRTMIEPPPPLDLPFAEIAVRRHSHAEVNGDFVEFNRHGSQGLDITLGDVMGKGTAAGMIGAAICRRIAMAKGDDGHRPSPSPLLDRVAAEMTPRLEEIGYFATLFQARVDVRRNVIVFCDCGSTKPILYRPSDDSHFFLEGENLPLGMAYEPAYQPFERKYEDGDILVLYSDGISESRRPGEGCFGVDGILDVVRTNCSRPVRELATAITDAAGVHAGQVADDSTVAVVRLHTGEGGINRRRYNASLAELSAVREWVSTISLDPRCVEEMKLAVNEAFCNLVKHGVFQCGSEIWLAMERNGHNVSVCLYDTATSFDPRNVAAPALNQPTESGRGVYLMTRLTAAIGYEPKPEPSGWNRLTLHHRDL